MTTRPNVIFVLADDMGYGDFSAFNPEISTTGCLDSLIRDGVTLANCYSSSPVCAPARASIMTGRYPQRCGVIDTLEARGYDRLKVSEVTMADVFKKNGYHTGLIGKWHLGAIGREYHPNNRGFDYFFGFRGGWNYYYDYIVERNGERVGCDGTYITDLFSGEAVDYVRKHAREPFFLHLAYNAPHFPFEAPQEIVEKYRQSGNHTEAVCHVYAMIECMDRGLGRVITELESLGIAENTIVVFASDNGPDFGGTGEDCLQRYNCDLNGSKMLAYEGGIRVPAVVKWPSKLPAGTVSREVVHGNDWLPTLISLCGLEDSDSVQYDGIDVSRALLGGRLEERTLYWQWNRHQPELNCNAAAREGSMKLVHAPILEYLDLPQSEIDTDVDIKSHPEKYRQIIDTPISPRDEVLVPIVQLFDLANDPGEKNDIAASQALRVQVLERSLREWFAEVEAERLAD